MILPLIVEPSEDMMTFFEENGTIVTTAEGVKYYFLPNWIEERKDGVHFLHFLNNLPEELLEHVSSLRGQGYEQTYTADDMIEFAQIFVRGCQKSKITPYQLEIFNKGKKNG